MEEGKRKLKEDKGEVGHGEKCRPSMRSSHAGTDAYTAA